MMLSNKDSENRIPNDRTSQMAIPLSGQQLVNSASPIYRSPDKTSVLAHVGSPHYVQQFRDVMDRQREAFDSERVLWQTERTELQQKILRLEASLRRYQAISSSQVVSPIEKSGTASGTAGVHNNADDVPRQTTAGDEFWRGSGGKSDARPTRTFSESSNWPLKVGDRLPSIDEAPITGTPKGSFALNPAIAGDGYKIAVPNIDDKNLDGINFKQSTRVASISMSLMTPQSPSPLQPLSPANLSPKANPVPSFLVAPFDPYTKDAGHTPLARKSQYDLDGSAISSDLATPTQPEVEKPPLEPRVSLARPPSERAESYFPLLDEKNGDIALKEPLGLKNSNREDRNFLQELDSKLLQAASAKPQKSRTANKENLAEEVLPPPFDQPEPEPKLRIKRSMNFGSQFGAAPCGKGF